MIKPKLQFPGSNFFSVINILYVDTWQITIAMLDAAPDGVMSRIVNITMCILAWNFFLS